MTSHRKLLDALRLPEELSDTQLMIVGDVYKMGDALSLLIEQAATSPGTDPAWLARAQYSLQSGINELATAIIKPEHF